MDQVKIGKFIAKLRKDNKMTQQELADKLNVTDRAIGNWENGRRMPDVVFYKPLCEIFKISITELLNGEKVSKSEMNSKSETILLNTIDYTSKEIKKAKKYKKIMIPLTILITLISIIMLDTIQAIVLKNSPIISWREEQFDEDSYVDRGILIDTYYCMKSDDIMTVIPTFKNTNFNCPLE